MIEELGKAKLLQETSAPCIYSGAVIKFMKSGIMDVVSPLSYLCLLKQNKRIVI